MHRGRVEVYTYTRVSTAMQVDGKLQINEEEQSGKSMMQEKINRKVDNDRLYRMYNKIEYVETQLIETK